MEKISKLRKITKNLHPVAYHLKCLLIVIGNALHSNLPVLSDFEKWKYICLAKFLELKNYFVWNSVSETALAQTTAATGHGVWCIRTLSDTSNSSMCHILDRNEISLLIKFVWNYLFITCIMFGHSFLSGDVTNKSHHSWSRVWTSQWNLPMINSHIITDIEPVVAQASFVFWHKHFCFYDVLESCNFLVNSLQNSALETSSVNNKL